MSEMNHDAFAKGEIEELSFNEIDEVDGGWIAAVVVVVFVAAPFVAGVIDGASGKENKSDGGE